MNCAWRVLVLASATLLVGQGITAANPARELQLRPQHDGAEAEQQSTKGPDTAVTDASSARKAVIAIVARIQRADYEGNRPELDKLYEELVPFVDEPEIGSRVRYWRGFAKWRNAINAFNENPTPKDLAEELTQGESEFDAAIQRDPAFVDAKVGSVSCQLLRLYQSGVFSKVSDPNRLRAILAPTSQMFKGVQAEAPQNPRLLWVLGPNQWSTPSAQGDNQEKAMVTYQKGLEVIRAQKGATSDPLEPSWGEPELLMNLAWSNLNKTKPDLDAAEKYAQSALDMVPYWHYVRDILMPQIRAAKAKLSSKD